MAFYRGSALSLLQHRMLPSVKQSRAFCGNTRDLGKIYRVPATRIREDMATRGRVSAASSSDPEPAQQEEAPPGQHSPASWVREGEATHGHGIVSAASSLEPVQQKESPLPGQQHSPASWVERWLPAAARPYALLARLDKPDAIWLYAWPCFWSIAIAANKAELPDMKMLALFGFGSVILRGAACTVNDLLDRDIDKKVERTKSRPLASGALTPAQGFYFLVFQDKKDDFKAGVKSTAITFGDNTKYWLSGFGAACISSLALTGCNSHLAWPYYPFLAAAAGHLAWQVSTVDLSNKSDCHRKFVSNKWFGAFLFGGILCGILASR
ncbi:hypothetical protein C2845_PM10G09490 [Panicum miliaceum]|uniref:4-hydroxybenzoate polyprenyltransferase, mitochondrial n=1 Tax=Panicum miliaceum TaxID=4540 RepID=A0A3L6PDR8_PANMI|nr:hypothetical protein C2845_PM10G09490 [Panicum miliaceum]